jgi:hypothetical protein
MGSPQLAYDAQVRGKGRQIVCPNLCFESVFGVGFCDWDYLTKENTERSVELLSELSAGSPGFQNVCPLAAARCQPSSHAEPGRGPERPARRVYPLCNDHAGSNLWSCCVYSGPAAAQVTAWYDDSMIDIV